jgi:hypothetical protein
LVRRARIQAATRPRRSGTLHIAQRQRHAWRSTGTFEQLRRDCGEPLLSVEYFGEQPVTLDALLRAKQLV